MKSSVALSLLAGISSVVAAGNLGLNIGAVRNSDSACKETSDWLDDFNTIKSLTDTVKVYASSDCNTLQNIGPAIEKAGLKLVLGVWPNDDAHFAAEKAALSNYLPNLSKDSLVAITVGSEALYREDLTAQELADKINDIREHIKDIKDKNGNSFSSVPVGTVDSWNVLVDGGSTPAIKAADIVFANAFSYWQGQTQANASYSFFDDIMQALQTIQTSKGSTDIQFWVGETGWPTGGAPFEVSQPSVDNAADFWQEGICAMRAWGVNVFAFEAFDESWKPDTSNIEGVEKHWGIFDASGSLKYKVDCESF
ncbi:glucan 1,3-beta-glucosidase precursor [Nadsonia fulvescens var. elongata DSM 6958]|uniref:glucan 1,3-beta-glucosidase n=1 Tax=Nadsonia fulvescens var. elongata DSM 6958 TaxID=857566 RepID=A0A1E3PQG2_9ASCO|nr:glucan 1,3-beta-glucosidase precursor [Nadsonia fulvescens var. elongata DSM 6958]